MSRLEDLRIAIKSIHRLAELIEADIKKEAGMNDRTGGCEYHFIDGDELWAWVTLPPTVAQRVSVCPHCGVTEEQEGSNADG